MQTALKRPRQWDIFCRVIDNHGDLSVCWRLARDLAARGERIRLWVDDASALAWMAPEGAPGVAVRPWPEGAGLAAPEPRTDVLVEAFGCEIPPAFLAATVAAWRPEPGATGPKQPAWFNLEYLSAEAYVERSHGLPSPVFSGPAAGWTKRFFFPGFTKRTGGLLREPGLGARQAAFDRAAWWAGLGLQPRPGALVASLFCYEPPALPDLLATWERDGHQGRPVDLLVTPGRAMAAVQACTPPAPQGRLKLHTLPHLPQPEFDHLLWACDFNAVRGEDSLVRAIWAGRPLIWQIYPQDDGAHHGKLQAFLDTAQATAGARAWHAAWNANRRPAALPAWPDAQGWNDWQAQAQALQARLAAQTDLVSQLLGSVAESG